MAQAQLYIYDEDNKKWIPLTAIAFKGSSSTATESVQDERGGGSGSESHVAETQQKILEAIGDRDVDNVLPDVRTLLDRLNNTQPLIQPSLLIATESGVIPKGAKFISIAIAQGSGSVLGTAVDRTIETIDFPICEAGYDQIPYTVNTGGKFIIVSGK